MKRLETTLRKNGFDYKQVEVIELTNGKRAYIYAQYADDPSNETEKILVSYEVFIARIQKEDITTPSNVVIPAGEKFPADREFGLTAWSVGRNLKKAKERLTEIFKQDYAKSHKEAA